MIIVKLICDAKIKERMRVYNIDKKKLENFLGYITNNLIDTRKVWLYEIDVNGLNDTGSGYDWGSDELDVALKCYGCRTKKERRIYFLQSLVHEYRHWVQSQIQKRPGNKIDYDKKDIAEYTDKYAYNEYEVECREWEDLVDQFNEFI